MLCEHFALQLRNLAASLCLLSMYRSRFVRQFLHDILCNAVEEPIDDQLLEVVTLRTEVVNNCAWSACLHRCQTVYDFKNYYEGSMVLGLP